VLSGLGNSSGKSGVLLCLWAQLRSLTIRVNE